MVINLQSLDVAIDRAAQEHGLINLTAAVEFVKESDPEAAQDPDIEQKVIEQIRRYVEDVRGYAVEELQYPDRRCFIILWKKETLSDPHFGRPENRARSN